MACSIKRKAGARVEPLSCVGNDDRPPDPQEVTAGNKMATAHLVYMHMTGMCCLYLNHLYHLGVQVSFCNSMTAWDENFVLQCTHPLCAC